MDSIVKVVQPTGILDGIKGHELRRNINDVIDSGANIVLIDLQDIKFMDSSGLGALVSAMKTVKTAGGKLYLCSVKDQVRMIFELTRIERVFESFSDRAEFERKVLATDGVTNS